MSPFPPKPSIWRSMGMKAAFVAVSALIGYKISVSRSAEAADEEVPAFVREIENSEAYGEYPESIPRGYYPYKLLDSWDVSPDSKLLRYQLPKEVTSLVALGAPSSLKAAREIAGEKLSKSYSPVSHPSAEGHLDLLVKRYPFRVGGGLGAFLCDMKPGDEIDMMLKPPRNMGLVPYSRNRFKTVVLLGAGTGVAPLLQLAKVIFEDPLETTTVHLLFGQRTEDDRLLQDRVDRWTTEKPDRFISQTFLSRPKNATAWVAPGGEVGRIDLKFLEQYLPTPSRDMLVVVCGTDEFLEDVSGMKVKTKIPGQSHPKKSVGPLKGYLKTLRFDVNGATVMKL